MTQTTLLTNATVFDGHSAELLNGQTVVINGGRIPAARCIKFKTGAYTTVADPRRCAVADGIR